MARKTVFDKIKIESEKCIIDYDAFLNFDKLEDFKHKQPLKYDDLLVEIYNEYYDGYNPPYMMYSPYYWEYSKNPQRKAYKCMFIRKGEDLILLTFKVTEIYGIKFVLIMDIPMSKNKNEENIHLVLNKLKHLNFIRFMFKEKYENYFKDILKIKEYSDYIIDFYFDIKTQLNKHTNKYLNQIKVPRYLTNSDFKVKITNKLNQNDIEEIKELRQKWYNDMPNVAKDDTEFYNVLTCGAENIYHCILYYKNKALSCETFELFKNCIMLWYVTHIGRYRNKLNDDYLKASTAEIRFTSLYFLTKWCEENKIDRIYYEGNDPGNTKLYHYKEKITDGSIKYLVIKENTHNI